MDIDTFNLMLGLAGLVLGLISAWGRIKAMTISALRAGSTGARRWVQRRTAQNEIFATHPTAFVAYLARSLLAAVFIFFAWRGVTGIVHSQVQAVISFLAPLLIGVLIGAAISRCEEMLELFKGRAASNDG